MEDLAILVDNKNDSTEAQDLLFSMGYKWRGLGEISKSYFYPKMNKYFIFMNKNEMDLQMAGYFAGSSRSYAESRFKEITLPELRDLVVLKRNDPNDGTHIDRDNKPWYVTSDNLFYCFEYGREWVKENQRVFDNYEVKPIEKPMKEYLIKSGDGKYLLTHHDSIGAIEIPEGANFAWKSDGKYVFFTALEMGYRDASVVWSRHTNPEELPFIDDEPKIETATGYQLDVVGSNTYGSRSRYDGESAISYRQYLMNFIVGNRTESLNDQYAEIEKVRQSAWQKQEGGSHYKNLKIQPMQYALENKLDYAQANVVKYVTRHKEKNGKEDLLKAIHNIELMIEFYYGDEK